MLERSSSDAGPSGGLLASYQTLHDVTRMLIGSASRDELLTRITRELKRLVPYDVLTIYRIDQARGQFDPLHVVDRFETHLEDHPFPLGTGFTGRAVDERRPINLDRADQVDGGELVPGTEWEPESLVIVPLMVRDQPIGTLNISRLGDDVAFSELEFDLICRFAEMAALALDNTEIRERLQQEAQTDHLTGLYNHRMFHERLRAELERAARYKRELSLIVFDLDDFKQLNDVHGHQEGDTVLGMVADVAAEGLRIDIDAAFRIGGEEFTILLPETGKAGGRARRRPHRPAGARDARGAADDRLLRRRDVPQGRVEPERAVHGRRRRAVRGEGVGQGPDGRLLGARCRGPQVAGLRDATAAASWSR